jgi:hypothetical protein
MKPAMMEEVVQASHEAAPGKANEVDLYSVLQE